jgi:hypothetical protein
VLQRNNQAENWWKSALLLKLHGFVPLQHQVWQLGSGMPIGRSFDLDLLAGL